MTHEEVRDIVRSTVRETLLELGIDYKRPLEVQADFQALREWRQTFHSARRFAFTTILATALAGVMAAFWLGFKSYLK